jgi:hypothetical protein
MVLPATLFAYEILRDNNLPDKYGEIAQRYIQASSEAFEEFEDDFHLVPNTNMGYLVMPHDGAPEPLSHASPYGATAAVLYKLTGKERYLDRAEQIANYFRASWQIDNDGSFSWPYRPIPDGKMAGDGEFFFKGRVTIMFPLIAYDLGIIFSKEEMQGLALTFTKNIYRGNNEFNTTVSKYNGRLVDQAEIEKRGTSIHSIAGWIGLSVVDKSIKAIIDNAMVERRDIFPQGWFGPPACVNAYACRF